MYLLLFIKFSTDVSLLLSYYGCCFSSIVSNYLPNYILPFPFLFEAAFSVAPSAYCFGLLRHCIKQNQLITDLKTCIHTKYKQIYPKFISKIYSESLYSQCLI